MINVCHERCSSCNEHGIVCSIKSITSKNNIMDLEKFASNYTRVTGKIPAGLKSILEPLPFWEKDFRTLIRFLYSENTSLGITEEVCNFASMSEMTIRADEKAFYIEGEPVFRWADDHVEKDGKFFYQNKSDVKFVFGADQILCALGDDYGGVICAHDEDVRSYFESDADKAKAKNLALYYIVCSILKDSPVLEKWGPVYNVHEVSEDLEEVIPYLRLTHNVVANQKTQLLIDNNGVWFGDDKQTIAEWKDYTVFKQKENNIDFIKNEKIIPVLQGVEQGVGDLLLTSSGIVSDKNFWWDSVSSGDGRDLDDLDIEDYDTPGIETEKYRYKKDGELKKAIFFLTNHGYDATHSAHLFCQVYYNEREDDHVVGAPMPGFDRNPLKIYYSKDRYISLGLPYFAKTEEGEYSIETYAYKLSRKDLRRIVSASSVKIVLTGDNETWTIKSSEFFNLAKDLETKISPKFLIDYYDAVNEYDEGNYRTASVKIQRALAEKPNNYYFQELNEKIQGCLVDAANSDYKKAEDLLNNGKYEEALKAGEALILISGNPEHKEFLSRVKEQWSHNLFVQAQKYNSSKEYVKAYDAISQASLMCQNEEIEALKKQISESLRSYFKDAINKAKDEKKSSVAGKYAEQAQKYFPNEDWVMSVLDSYNSYKRKTRLKAITIVAVFILLAIFTINIGEDKDKTATTNTSSVSTPKQEEQHASEEPQNLTSIPQSEEPVIEAVEPPVAEDAVDEEVVELTEYYKGLIDGKYPITVDLYIDLEKAKGSYYYDKYGPDNRLTLDGEWVANDEGGSNLVIKEYNAAGKLIGTFEVEGHSADMDYLEGTYTLLSKDKKMPFVLNLQQ